MSLDLITLFISSKHPPSTEGTEVVLYSLFNQVILLAEYEGHPAEQI